MSAAAGGPLKHSDETFTDETVQLDDCQFERCTFVRCVLHYSGGPPPSLSRCKFDAPQFAFDGAASNVAVFMRGLYNDPAFRPIIEATLNDISANNGRGVILH